MNAMLALQQTTVQPPAAPLPPEARDQIREAIRENVRAQVEAARAQAEAARAQRAAAMAQGQPGTIVIPPLPPSLGPDIPQGAIDISIAFFVTCAVIAIGLPLARAFARRMDRKGALPALPGDTTARLERIEQAVEAIAIEVERISEGQRYTTRVVSELRALPQPSPLDRPWPAGARPEAAGAERPSEP